MIFSTSVTCSIVAAATDYCRFAVRSVVCSNISSPVSNRVDVQLKVPEPPEIVGVVARYAGSNDGLLATDIYSTEVNPFNITNEVEGSPLYYSITYTESISGFQCGSLNISSFSACNNGVCLCSTNLPSSCFHLSGVITISLSATNRLGRGLSTSFDISTTNIYFVVKLSPDSVVCTFNGMQSQQLKSCSIIYGPCQQQQFNNATMSVFTDPVQLTLPTELKNGDCYFLNASNGTFTVLQRGVYSIRDCPSALDDKSIIIISVALLLGVMIAGSLVVSIFKFVNHRRAYDRLIGHHGEYMHLTNAITFKLQDKLWTLLKVLEAFKKCGKNIVDAKIDDSNEPGMREITIECEEVLNSTELKRIRKSLTECKNYEQERSSAYPYRIQYTKVFPGKAGSLYRFLKAIYDRSQYNNHYCIDIIELNVRRDMVKDSKSKEITLTFNSTSESQSQWDGDLDAIFDQTIGQND